MTDEDLLRRSGLTDDEIDEMSDLGWNLNVLQDVSALQRLVDLYLDAGLEDEAARVYGNINDAIDYMQQTVYESTGWAIQYNDIIGQWQYLGGQGERSGQLIGYLGFDRNLPDDVYEQMIIDELGTAPPP